MGYQAAAISKICTRNLLPFTVHEQWNIAGITADLIIQLINQSTSWLSKIKLIGRVTLQRSLLKKA